MKKRQSGFTLLEILVVALIGVLLRVAMYKMAPALDVAKGTKTKADIQMIRTMLLSYSGSNGFYPTTEQGLKALVVRPDSEPAPMSWRRLMEDVPKDASGTENIYPKPR